MTAPLSRHYGDGKQTIHIIPADTRPHCYEVRVDSSWAMDGLNGPLAEALGKITRDIEDEFGIATWCDGCPDGCDGQHDNLTPWPAAAFDSGYSWGAP